VTHDEIVTTLALSVCIMHKGPFTYRDDDGPRRICDGCLEYMAYVVSLR
jgi:hypothetical protein